MFHQVLGVHAKVKRPIGLHQGAALRERNADALIIWLGG